MWITDLQKVLNVLFEMYGMTCCINSISNGRVYMANGDCHDITDLLGEDDG